MRDAAGTQVIAIVGGGASGMAAAIVAAQKSAHTSTRVCLFEKSARIGSSILRAGNGRCNFSHVAPSLQNYHNASFVEAVFDAAEQRFERGTQQNVLLSFFESLGLVWREEGDGRLYPASLKASSVLDVLRFALEDAGVEIYCEKELVEIARSHSASEAFTLRFADGYTCKANAVILACAAACTRVNFTSGIVLSLRSFTPTLGPLKLDRDGQAFTRNLDNIRIRAGVYVRGNSSSYEQGEVLFRKYGLSGIVIFNISRMVSPKDTLVLDLLPEKNEREVTNWLETRARMLRCQTKELSWQRLCDGWLLPRVAAQVLRRAGFSPEDVLQQSGIARFAATLKGLEFRVAGIADENQCQSWRGGVPVSSLVPSRMECRDVAGLYVVGEATDVDAACGGYNLHYAFVSGMLAGAAAVSRTLGECN